MSGFYIEDNGVLPTLVGETLQKIDGAKVGSDKITFLTAAGRKFRMYYDPDCCADCRVEDIAGDINDLIGSPLTMAEAVSNHENPEGVKPKEYEDSFTWTFVKFATVKGYVTLRWYGSSNGYYSENVSFEEIK